MLKIMVWGEDIEQKGSIFFNFFDEKFGHQLSSFVGLDFRIKKVNYNEIPV